MHGMAYEIHKLQNVSGGSDETPEIAVQKGDPEWDKSLETWKQGKPPTDSPLWKRGVFAIFHEVKST